MAPAPDLSAPFGPEVEARFPGSAYDIDEAGRCLALRRPTATVHHCLCILEQGLRGDALWRGAVLQVGPKYTEEEAERIFGLVEPFMRRLAQLCDEDGEPATPPEG